MELDLSLEAYLKSADDSLKRLRKNTTPPRWRNRRIAQPLPIKNGGTFFFNMGTPPTGSIWNPTAISVVDADGQGTPTNFGFFAMGFGDADNPTPADLIYTADTSPYSSTFSTNALWCYASEHLYVALQTPGGADCVAVVHLREYNESDIIPPSV